MPQGLRRFFLYRLVLLSLFLAGGLMLQWEGISFWEGPWWIYYALLALLYLGTLFALWPHPLILYAMVTLDVVGVTGLLWITGGGRSPFFPVYMLVIIEGGVLLERRGGVITALLCGLAYGIMLNTEYLALPHSYKGFYLLYRYLLALLSFLLAGYVIGFLWEESRSRSRELQRSREDYRRLEAFSRYVLESISSGLITTDRNNRITFVNRAAERILGVKEEGLFGRPINQLFPKFKGGAKERIEIPYRRGREDLILGLSVSTMKDHLGRTMGRIFIFQDLTQWKELEESMKRAEKLAAVGQLAAGLAHEIRNPMASISGAIQLFKDEGFTNPNTERLMNIIITESNRLNRLISDFLLYAQPPKVRRERVNLSKVVKDTLELFFHSPEYRHGIELVEEIEEDVTVPCDPQQIQQVLWNLLLNAVEAMDGRGSLRVELYRDLDRESAVLKVEDTGVGMSQDEVERIFEPFFTTKERGTGLGLSIVHKIVEKHGGAIGVRSRKGEGSVFTVTLPLKVQKGE
ncbi:MAG: hypothetical protein DRG55_00125 [Deltaproteobacteria bacterium]|nr:MAG: hypothetical protein DRG55_00125 [Deltaproteobacteria bacterium]